MHTRTDICAPKDLPRSLGIFYVAWFGADRAGVEFSKRRAAASRIVRWSGVAEQHAIVDASCDGFGSRAGGDTECLSRVGDGAPAGSTDARNSTTPIISCCVHEKCSN